MVIDFDNVLKLGFNTGSNGAALTITHVGGELPIPPVVLFSGLISESALTTELLEGGLHYNYFAFDQIMGVPNPEDGALYNITDKEMQIVISSRYNGGVPNPGNLTLNSSFREWVVDYLVWNSELEVMESVAEIDWSEPVSFDELVIHFPAGSTPTLNVPVILLSNTNDRDIGVNVSVTGDNVIENHGTAESYTLTDTTGSFCLMQRREVGEPIQNHTSQCFGLEGLFAIEINGEVVPHYFKAEDLPAYFNANNPHNVQFVECPIRGFQMPDFKIKILNSEYIEVRIIPITAASAITNTHGQLSPLDDSGYEYGIILAPNRYDGAITHPEIINTGGEVLEGPNPFTFGS